MLRLNYPSTAIFARLLTLLDQQPYERFDAKGCMPLVIEKRACGIQTATGTGVLYSLFHFYLDPRNTFLHDLEMRFIVVDKRVHPLNFTDLYIYPQRYAQDNTRTYQESVIINNRRIAIVYCPQLQLQQVCFAEHWLYKISQQGFLNRL